MVKQRFRTSIFVTRTLLLLALIGGIQFDLQSATILVPADQATIQGAVGAASSGDTIEITNSAVYVEDVTIDKTITLKGADGQRPTIQNLNSIERFAHLGIVGPDCLGTVVRAPGCVLQNITFSNPQEEADAAGVSAALSIIAPNTTVDNCTITTLETAPEDNVGAAVVDLDLPTGGNPPMNTVFKNCVFDTNKYGLAVSWFIAPALIPNVTIEDCTFTNNSASALEMDTGDIDVKNCSFTDNQGTGIEAGAGFVRVYDTVFARNGLVGGSSVNVELASNWDETEDAPVPAPIGEALPAGTAELHRCVIYDHGEEGVAFDPAVRVHEGTLIAQNTIFTENNSTHLAMDNGGEETTPAEVYIDHCDFYQSLNSSEIVISDIAGGQHITFEITNSIISEGDGTFWAIDNEFFVPVPENNFSAHYNAIYDPMLGEGDLFMEESNNLYFDTGLPPYNSTDPMDPGSFLLPAGHALLTAGMDGTFLGARGTGIQPHPPIVVTIEATESGVQLCWNSQENRSYEVQKRSSLNSGNWVTVETVSSQGDTTCWDAATDTEETQFWQIVLP